MNRKNIARMAALLALGAAVTAKAAAPVSESSDDRNITLDNGLVRIVVSRRGGFVESISDVSGGSPQLLAGESPRNESGRAAIGGGPGMYWDSNATPPNPAEGVTVPKKGYFRLGEGDDRARVVRSWGDLADVEVTGGKTPAYPLAVEYHFVLQRGVSGLYAYVVLRHGGDDAALRLDQTRFVVRTVSDGTFDFWSTGSDAFVKIPTAAVTAKVMDATFRLADGTVKTKYLNSVYWGQTPVYGVLGHDADSAGAQRAVGLWMIEASPEYHNGGPVKQGQTVHDNVLLRVLQSVHFGASPVVLAAGEKWEKVYGPFLLYLNHASDAKGLWADAEERQKTEAADWPYAWVKSPEYAKARGAVSGRLNLDGGSASGAWVILADAASAGPWTAQSKGYEFWTRASADGSFAIRNVIPGTYTLYASGGDQPEDFSKTDIVVSETGATVLGTLEWKPVTHGEKLWQIGTFDRSAGEFCNGTDARQYQMFSLYPKQFPDDVKFVVGKSDITRDWNYAQWSWYAKDPKWRIDFDLKDALSGKATLTLGFASAQPAHGRTTDLRVAVNGKEIAAIHLPKTGTAGYRGGVQDSPYNVKDISFDASLLHSGTNEITLWHADAEPFHAIAESTRDSDDAPPGTGFPGQVMYDALRLEVQR